MILFYVLLGLIVAGFLLVLDRRDQRAMREHESQRVQVAELLQRIQAPQAAVAEHHELVTAVAETPSGLPPGDEELAQMQERDRLIMWMEAVENGTAAATDGVPMNGAGS